MKKVCFLLLGLIFISCKNLYDKSNNEFYLRGKIIVNYPDWLNPKDQADFCQGISDWLDWQDEQGVFLQQFVDNSLINSKYKFVVSGQDIGLRFDDENATQVAIMFTWIKDVGNSCNNALEIEQTDINKRFEYDCHALATLKDKKTSENKAHVTFNRISEGDTSNNEYQYLLEINGEQVINVILKNSKDDSLDDYAVTMHL